VEGFKRQIGCISSPRVLHHIVRLGSRAGTIQDLADVNTLPDVAIAAPGGDAVDVTGDSGAWQRQQLLPGQLERLLKLPPHLEAIGLGIELRSGFVTENGPLLGEVLALREAIESIGALLGRPAFTLGAKEAGKIHG